MLRHDAINRDTLLRSIEDFEAAARAELQPSKARGPSEARL
jgi:hypothetical protein